IPGVGAVECVKVTHRRTTSTGMIDWAMKPVDGSGPKNGAILTSYPSQMRVVPCEGCGVRRVLGIVQPRQNPRLNRRDFGETIAAARRPDWRVSASLSRVFRVNCAGGPLHSNGHSEPQRRISLSSDAYECEKERSFVPQNDLVNWLSNHEKIG